MFAPALRLEDIKCRLPLIILPGLSAAASYMLASVLRTDVLCSLLLLHVRNSHVVMMHGATPVSEHSDPDSMISVAQQSAEVNVELTGVHPTPPQAPHSATQHASKLEASTPAIPLLHMDCAPALHHTNPTQNADRTEPDRKGKASRRKEERLKMRKDKQPERKSNVRDLIPKNTPRAQITGSYIEQAKPARSWRVLHDTGTHLVAGV